MSLTQPGRLTAPQRRSELLRAGTTVFARAGYRGARVSDIAAEAGVSEPLLYRHFPSKKALFCELLDRIGRRIVEIWQNAVADAPDALEALRRAGRVYVRNLAEHPAEARLQFQALAENSDPEIAAVLRTNHQRYVAFFDDLLEQGRSQGVLRAELDTTAAAWLLNGMGVAFTVRDLLFPDDGGGSPTVEANESTIDTMIAWLAVPSSTSPKGETP